MAIERITRPLNPEEKRVLSRTLSREQQRLRLMLTRVVVFQSVVFGALWALTILAARQHWLLVTAFWAMIGVGVAFWAYRDARREVSSRILRVKSALLRNEARVTRIQSQWMVEIEESEDEGACYAFQVDEEEIVFITGQDYYSSARFPNSDFSLVQVMDSDEKIFEEVISKQGTKLKPVRSLPATIKSRLKSPDHMQSITGRIENLETLPSI